MRAAKKLIKSDAGGSDARVQGGVLIYDGAGNLRFAYKEQYGEKLDIETIKAAIEAAKSEDVSQSGYSEESNHSFAGSLSSLHDSQIDSSSFHSSPNKERKPTNIAVAQSSSPVKQRSFTYRGTLNRQNSQSLLGSSSHHKTKNLLQQRQMSFRQSSMRTFKEIEGAYEKATASDEKAEETVSTTGGVKITEEEPLSSSFHNNSEHVVKEIEDSFHKAMNDFPSTELTEISDEFAEG